MKGRVACCLALRRLALSREDGEALARLRAELARVDEVSGRWGEPDLDAAILEAAVRVRERLGDSLEVELEYHKSRPPEFERELDEELEALVAFLSQAGERLLAVFGLSTLPGVRQAGDVQVGPASELAHPDLRAAVGWDDHQLAILIELQARGRLAPRAGIERLREVLGGLYYAAIRAGQDPGLQPGTPGDIPSGSFVLAGAATPVSAQVLRCDGLLLLDLQGFSEATYSEFEAVIAHPYGTFAGERVAAGLSWLQRGIDAVSHSESVLALGVALESVIGDASSHDVMATLRRRLPFVLLPDGPPLHRLDVITDAERFYEHRSKVAHGRFSRQEEILPGLDEERRDFARFVVRTIAGFVSMAEEHGWEDEAAMRRWFELAAVS